MIRPDTIITVLFAAILPVFFILPWIAALEGSPINLSGVGLAFGQYDARPLEYYALAAVAVACVGAVLPNLIPKNKTMTRVCLSVAGASVMLLMLIQVPAGIQNVEWGMGYWLSLTLFTITAFVSVYVLGRVHERSGRRGRRRR